MAFEEIRRARSCIANEQAPTYTVALLVDVDTENAKYNGPLQTSTSENTKIVIGV